MDDEDTLGMTLSLFSSGHEHSLNTPLHRPRSPTKSFGLEEGLKNIRYGRWVKVSASEDKLGGRAQRDKVWCGGGIKCLSAKKKS
jgi:hypothetical protein